MYIFFYKRYPDAKSATVISAFGGLFIVIGVFFLISGFAEIGFEAILPALISAGIGFLLRKLADKQAVIVWKKKGMEHNHHI